MLFTTEYLNRILMAKDNLMLAINRLGGNVKTAKFADYPNIISGLTFEGKVSVKLESANNGMPITENDTNFSAEEGHAFNYAKVAIPFDLEKNVTFTENGTYSAKKDYKKEGITSFKVDVNFDADDCYPIEKTIVENGTYKASDEVENDSNLQDDGGKKTLVPAFTHVEVALPMVENATITENGTYDAEDWPIKSGDSAFQGFATGDVNLLYIDKTVELISGEEKDLYIDLESSVNGVKPSGYKSVTVKIKPGETKTEYTANFYNGTILLASVVLPAGSTPAYAGTTPTKSGYMFVGWDPAPSKIDHDTNFFAVFEPLSAGQTSSSENSVSWGFLSDSEYIEDPENPIVVGKTKKHLNIGCIKIPETNEASASLFMCGGGVDAYCIGKNQDNSKYIWAFKLDLGYSSGSPSGNIRNASNISFFVPTPEEGIPITTDSTPFSTFAAGSGSGDIKTKYAIKGSGGYVEEGKNDEDINITYENSFISTFLDKLADAIEEQNPGLKINTVEKRYAKLASNGQYEQFDNYTNARCWFLSFKESGIYDFQTYNPYEESRDYTFPSALSSYIKYGHIHRADVASFSFVYKWDEEKEAYTPVYLADGKTQKKVSRGYVYGCDISSTNDFTYSDVVAKTARLNGTYHDGVIAFAIG